MLGKKAINAIVENSTLAALKTYARKGTINHQRTDDKLKYGVTIITCLIILEKNAKNFMENQQIGKTNLVKNSTMYFPL